MFPGVAGAWQPLCLAGQADVRGMKILMLCGALIGFSLGIALGYAGRAGWPGMLWHAAAAAAVLGWLMRWWGRVWTTGLRASLEQRRALELAARQQTPSTSVAKK
jgi:hypothetical protein